MGSSSQESTGSSIRNKRSNPFLGLDNLSDEEEVGSLTSLTPTDTPISPVPSSYPIVVPGSGTGKRTRITRTDTPPPPTPQLDSKMYEFLDKVIARSQETPAAATGYKLKIENFSKVLTGMMEDIPENCFSSYMQESIKTLQSFTNDFVLVTGRSTPTPVSNVNPELPNLLNTNIQTIPSTSTSTDISSITPINYSTNQPISTANFTSDVNVTADVKKYLIMDMATQEPEPAPESFNINSNYVMDTLQTQSQNMPAEHLDDEEEEEDVEDDEDLVASQSIISGDALTSDGQIFP